MDSNTNLDTHYWNYVRDGLLSPFMSSLLLFKKPDTYHKFIF